MMHNIGMCIIKQQNRELLDASEMLVKAFEGRRKLLGSTHLDTLVSMFEVGKVLHCQSHWRHKPDAAATRQKAQDTLYEAMIGFERVLGEQDRLTVAATKYLADFLFERSVNMKSTTSSSSNSLDVEEMYRRVLTIERVGSGCKVSLLETMYKLATVLEAKLQKQQICSSRYMRDTIK